MADFEHSLDELETLVQKLERGDLTLDDSLQAFERAVALERMHAHKTGALIRAAVVLGALAGGCADEVALDALDRYAGAVGLAFQIRDDILDVEGDTAVIGKQQGSDQARAKPTYPAILGMAAARALCEAQRAAALAALDAAGLAAGQLRDLAHYAVDRGH